MREDVTHVLLANIVSSEDAPGSVDGEGLEALFISSVLSKDELAPAALDKVELAAEDRWEVALSWKLFEFIFGAFSLLVNAEVKDEAGDLLNHAFQATAANDGDVTVIERHACLDVKAVDLVLCLLELVWLFLTNVGPFHLARVLSSLISPEIAALQVKERTLDRELSVHDKREHSLVLPVDSNGGGDVMTEGQFGSQLPLLRSEVEALTAAVLAPAHHEQLLTVIQNACSGSHGVLAEGLGKFFR